MLSAATPDPSPDGKVVEDTGPVVKVQSVSVAHGEDTLSIEIIGSGPMAAKTMKLSSPSRVVVDVANAVLNRNQTIAVNSGNIKDVRVGQFQSVPPVTRVVVDLNSPENFELVPFGNRLLLKLHQGFVSSKARSEKQHPAYAEVRTTSPATAGNSGIQPKVGASAAAITERPLGVTFRSTASVPVAEVTVSPVQLKATSAMSQTSAAAKQTTSLAQDPAANPESNQTLASSAKPSAAAEIATIAATTTDPGVQASTMTTTDASLQASTTTTTTTPSLTLSLPSAITLTPGASGNVLIKTSVLNGFNAAVSFSASTASYPGITTSFSPSSVAAPGQGSTLLTIHTSTTTPGGMLYLSVAATGGGQTFLTKVQVTISTTSTLLIRSSSPITLGRSQSGTLAVATSAMYGFNSSVSLSVSSSYAGVTAKLSPTSIAAPGQGGSTLYVTVSSTATIGTYYLKLTASGGGKTSQTYVAVVVPSPTLVLSSSGAISVTVGKSASVTISTTPQYGFSSLVSLSAKISATGTTAALSITAIPAPGKGSCALTVRTSTTTPAGTYNASVTATGGGLTKTLPVTVKVGTPAPGSSGHLVSVSFSPSSTANVTYNIYRCSGSTCSQSGNFSRQNVSAVTVSPYPDAAVVSGVTYYYAVKAVDGNGLESAMSNVGVATVP
jgi:hypothetical protein